METQDNIPYNLFAKFFTGEISEKEQKVMDEFISEKPENEKIFNEYQMIWSLETDNLEFEDKTETALNSVKKQIHKTEKIIPINRNKHIWLKFASVIIIVLGISYFFVNNISKQKKQYVTIKTTNKIKEHKLADGSIVWLNKNSEIIIDEDFNKQNRKVHLKGEAYFIVSHNKQKPFIVETQKTTTEVLGTEFNIKSIDSEEDIEVTLKKGTVKFTDTKTNVSELMKPTDKIILRKNGRQIQKETVLNNNYLSWKTKELTFNNMKLSEVAKTISENYNIKIKADNSVKNTIITSTIPFNNLHDILITLKLTIGIKIDTINGEIILKK